MKTIPAIVGLAATAALCAGAGGGKPKRPVEGIMDNSFLVEKGVFLYVAFEHSLWRVKPTSQK